MTDASPPQQPRTEAGRRLLAGIQETSERLDVALNALDYILAIEEQARAVEPPLPVDRPTDPDELDDFADWTLEAGEAEAPRGVEAMTRRHAKTYCESDWHEPGCPSCHQSGPAPALDVPMLAAAIDAADLKAPYSAWASLIEVEYARLSGTEPGKPTALSRTDPPRCDECGRVGYIVGVGADLRIGGHLDQRVKHPFRSGTEPGE